MTKSRSTSSPGGVGMNLVGGLAVLFAVLALAWMILLPRVVTGLVRDRTGFDLTLGSLYLNPFDGALRVRGLMVANPPDFPRRVFLDVPELEVEARPASLFGSPWRINAAAVHVAEVAFVRDSRGRLNDRLFARGIPDLTSTSSRSPLIKRLDLRVDRVVMVDDDRGQPKMRNYDIHFHRVFSDVTDLRAVVEAVIVATGRDFPESGGIVSGTGSLLHQAGADLENAGRKTGESVKGLIESLEKKLRK
jgi:hypothetical protein